MPSKTKLQNHSNDEEADQTGEIQIKQIQKVTYTEQQKSHWIYNPSARFLRLKSNSLYSDRLASKQLNDPVIHWFALWNMTNTSALPYHLTCEALVWLMYHSYTYAFILFNTVFILPIGCHYFLYLTIMFSVTHGHTACTKPLGLSHLICMLMLDPNFCSYIQIWCEILKNWIWFQHVKMLALCCHASTFRLWPLMI